MIEILKDEIISLGAKKFRYKSSWYENHGSIIDSMGEIELSEIDVAGNESGLYIRNRHHNSDEALDETAKTLVGTKKDGRLDGTRYLFENGKLTKVKANDEVIVPQDLAFLVYEKKAPNFKTSFDMLKKAKAIIDDKRDAQFMANLKQLEERGGRK